MPALPFRHILAAGLLVAPLALLLALPGTLAAQPGLTLAIAPVAVAHA